MDTVTPEAPAASPVFETLTALDRCDACGAAAYYKLFLESGAEFLFCIHHYQKHGPKLEPQTAGLVDESERLFAQERNRTRELV